MFNGMTYPQCGHARWDMGKNITTDAPGLRPTSWWSDAETRFCGAKCRFWPIAPFRTHALNGRFRGEANIVPH
jgi:hypothetical protein